jgi:hypothetical protein
MTLNSTPADALQCYYAEAGDDPYCHSLDPRALPAAVRTMLASIDHATAARLPAQIGAGQYSTDELADIAADIRRLQALASLAFRLAEIAAPSHETLQEIRAELWPDGDKDAEWTGDTLPAVAEIITAADEAR